VENANVDLTFDIQSFTNIGKPIFMIDLIRLYIDVHVPQVEQMFFWGVFYYRPISVTLVVG
jgi:hypothetical protein